MIIHLANRLNIPMRDCNAALLAAGFAPAYSERPLDDPEMAAALRALRTLLKAHEPNPALALDRHWHIVHANNAVAPILAGVLDPALLTEPVNVLRLSLHPAGLAPRIQNLKAWRAHLLHRLERQIAVTRDTVLADLRSELLSFDTAGTPVDATIDPGGVLVPLHLKTGAGTLSFISTTTVFGTPRDVLLSELAIEAFFPGDSFTAHYLSKQKGTVT